MVKDILNKGIPNSITIGISTTTLGTLSNDSNDTQLNLRKEEIEIRRKIEKLTNDFFLLQFPAIVLVTDTDSLESFFSFSAMNYYLMLNRYLNLDVEDAINMSNQELYEYVKNLSTVKKEDKFRKKYKNLYNEYDHFKKLWKNREKIVTGLKLSSDASVKDPETMDLSSNKWKKIHDLTNFDYYKDFIVNILVKYIDNRKEITTLLNEHRINDACFKNINEEKMQLFLCYMYMHAACTTDEFTQQALYYVINYFNEDNNRKTDDDSLIIYDDDRITPKFLYDELKSMLVYNPELYMVDLPREYFKGKNLDEVEKFMEDYIKEIKVSWDFLVPNEENDLNVIKKVKSNFNKEEKDEEEIQEKLEELYFEKKKIFESNNPVFMISGKNKFEGYVGYLFNNGEVILDKLFDNKNKSKLSFGNAIYAMPIEKFGEITLLSKKNIIDNNLCTRIIHRGNWQEKVLDIINSGEEKNLEENISRIRKSI